MYGRGEKSIAEQLGCSPEEAKEIKNNVYDAFPRIKIFERESAQMVREKGYVTTLWNRRRRLPDYNLPVYEFHYINENGEIVKDMKIPESDVEKYTNKLNNTYWKNRENYINELRKIGILVIDNGSKIAAAGRQIINSRVQGCLDGNVRVQSKEYGFIKLKDYVNKTLTIWDGKEWTKGTIVNSGKKQKCIIHFIGGQTFVCSPNHKFETILTNSNHVWKTCDKLTHGLHIEINHQYIPSEYKYKSNHKEKTVHNANNVYIDDIQNSFKAGRMLGRLASDGSYFVRENAPSGLLQIIAEHEFNIIPELEDIMCSLNARTKYKDVRQNRNQKIANISIYSKSLAEEIMELDIKHKISDNLFMDTELLRGFISGFFDGDGGISGNNIKLCFGKQYNFEPMILDIQKALLFYGIRSSYQNLKNCYRLLIKKQDSVKFTEIIGFMNNIKQEKAKQLIAIKDEHIFGFNMCVDYVEITDEYIDMYDVCNTKNGYFIADGLVTHNSAADMSKLALVKIRNDEELVNRGVRPIIPVHDEILIETPLRYAKYVKERFKEDMETAAKPTLTIPVCCDVVTTQSWYSDELDLNKELQGLPDD